MELYKKQNRHKERKKQKKDLWERQEQSMSCTRRPKRRLRGRRSGNCPLLKPCGCHSCCLKPTRCAACRHSHTHKIRMLHAESGAHMAGGAAGDGAGGGARSKGDIGASHPAQHVQFTFANVKAIAWATKITRQCVGLKDGVDEGNVERGEGRQLLSSSS